MNNKTSHYPSVKRTSILSLLTFIYVFDGGNDVQSFSPTRLNTVPKFQNDLGLKSIFHLSQPHLSSKKPPFTRGCADAKLLPIHAKHTFPLTTLSLSSSEGQERPKIDPIIVQASRALRRSSWLSWWVQVILTTISSVTLIFAKSVLSVQNSGGIRNGAGGFFLAGSGIALSFLSIIWTWGETRLSRRLLRRDDTTRISAASITRRAVTIGISINLIGMALTLLGAEQIVGVLAAKALSFQSLAGGGGAGGGLGINSPGSFVAQTLQPLDILIVQANTNTLLSHFVSMFLLLWWGQRWILKLDPPRTVDDEYYGDYARNRGRRRRRIMKR